MRYILYGIFTGTVKDICLVQCFVDFGAVGAVPLGAVQTSCNFLLSVCLQLLYAGFPGSGKFKFYKRNRV